VTIAPIFSTAEFLGATQMDNAVAAQLTGYEQDIGALHTPGVVNGSAVTITTSGLNVTFTFGATFAAVTQGLVCFPLGTTNGSTTNVYTVNTASLVPSSGSQTIYFVMQQVPISQTPYTVVGPPSGHPDYSATFAPYTAYAQTDYSFSVTATTTAPNNTTSIELARTILTAGQSTVVASNVVTTSQVNAGSVLTQSGVSAGSYTLTNFTVGADGRITAASTGETVNITGSITTTSASGTAISAANGSVYAQTLATTTSGSLGVGTGGATFGGNISVSGSGNFTGSISAGTTVSAGTYLYAANYVTTGSTGYIAIGTGASSIGGTLAVSGNFSANYVTATGGANFGAGTVYTGTLNASGNVNAPNFVASGVVNATGGGTIGGVNISGNNVSAPGYGNFSGGLYVAGTYPGLGYTFYVNGNSYHAGAATFASSGTFIGLVTANDGLTVNGSTLVASDNATIYGSLTIVGNTAAEWQCNAYGAGNPAMQCSVGLVAGTYGFNAITGYYLGPAGVAAYGTFSGQFAFSSGEGNLQGLAFYATSDVRLKENFAPITAEDGMAFVRAAKPTAFDWKADGSHGTGYVAQQLLAAGFPHLVSAVYDENVEEETHEFDGVSVTSMKTVRMIAKYDDMIALLHAALIGALDRADAAEARLTAIEARLG
jgi:hypothetical protein